jgi:hypothetical protein
MIFFHWYLGNKLRLLHYVRNDGPLQDVESWQGLIFGRAENQPLPTLLNLKGRVIASRAKQSSFKTIDFAGPQGFFTKMVALYST